MSTANSRLRPAEKTGAPRRSAADIMSAHVEAQMRAEMSRLTRELLDLQRMGYEQDEVMICQEQGFHCRPYVTLGVYHENGLGRNRLAGR